MDAIYHGSVFKKADGTNKIIVANEKFLFPTDKCRWKFPSNVSNGVKNRSKIKKNELAINYEEVDKYIAIKCFIH